MHLIKKETSTHQDTVKEDNPTPFRPWAEIPDYEPRFIDPQN